MCRCVLWLLLLLLLLLLLVVVGVLLLLVLGLLLVVGGRLLLLLLLCLLLLCLLLLLLVKSRIVLCPSLCMRVGEGLFSSSRPMALPPLPRRNFADDSLTDADSRLLRYSAACHG